MGTHTQLLCDSTVPASPRLLNQSFLIADRGAKGTKWPGLDVVARPSELRVGCLVDSEKVVQNRLHSNHSQRIGLGLG